MSLLCASRTAGGKKKPANKEGEREGEIESERERERVSNEITARKCERNSMLQRGGARFCKKNDGLAKVALYTSKECTKGSLSL